MPSGARLRLDQNATDVLVLWHIHADATRSGKSKNSRTDVLNRATIIFISACWESYIEDVAVEGFDFLLENAASPDSFPAKVRTLASKELREAKDERRVWALAGAGWQQVLRSHRDCVIARWLQDFNTPKSSQVSELFANLLDYRDITAAWSWPGMTTEEARRALDHYMTIRGNIAHRTKHSDAVHKTWSKRFFGHVLRLADRTDEALTDHLRQLTGITPW